MNLEIIKPQNNLWFETLQQLRHDVYHLPQYVVLDAKRTETTPEAFLLRDEDKIFLVPYLLRSCRDIIDSDANNEDLFDIISPYGYPGILLSEAARNSPDFATLALTEFRNTLQQKEVCSAFLRLHPILDEKFLDIFPANTFIDNGQTVSIDLTLDEGAIWAKTRRGHQSTINKCKRLGLTARRVDFHDYFDEFLDIYEETMDRVKAKDVYYFSHSYFRELLNLGDRIHLGIVESAGEIVCASLFFESCGIVQAHLGGTRTNFLKQSPFNLLLHFMSLWAKARDNEYLHIGGGVGGKKDNLFTFKSGFSKQRHQFFTLRLVVDETKYSELTISRAKELNKSPEELIESQFFPAYRAS